MTAVLVETGPDAGAVWHYGDPVAEQRALESGAAAVDLSHRPVIKVSGPDRLKWLHSLTSQHLEKLEPYAGTTALILSPHGHVEHHLTLVDDGEAVWLHVEPGTAEALVGYLEGMKFWSEVDVADVSGTWGVVRDRGVSDGKELAVSAPGQVWRDLFLPREEIAEQLRAYDRRAGLWAAEALRVEAKIPRLGFETDHRTIPHEVGWIGEAVHLDKGCYRGQETVARVENLGRPPRRLVFLHLDGSDVRLPEHSDSVELEGRNVGFVGTAVRHHELGPIALAVIKRTTPVEAPLLAGGVPAMQEAVVAP